MERGTESNEEDSVRGTEGFLGLDPNVILLAVEKYTGRDFSNLFRSLNSYINRVFELEDLDGKRFIVKFYRPGRWTREAILAEHRFLIDLKEREVPVIAPLALEDDSTLGACTPSGCCAPIFFALFEKCGGRSVDECTDDQWQTLGRLVGRMHGVGRMRQETQRRIMTPERFSRPQLAYLERNALVAPEVASEFFALGEELIALIEPLFETVPLQRIHGDLHLANVIYRPGEGHYLIDFDDMVVGPVVQDLWMLLPGSIDTCLFELEEFLEGYETFLPFARKSLLLIEPLRAMRYIHYLAWCGCQVVEDGRTQVLPDYGTSAFWQQETQELRSQLVVIRSSLQEGLPL